MKSTGKAIDLQNSKAKLNLSETNIIDCGGGDKNSGDASHYIGIYAASGSELTIDGSGSLEVKNPSYYGVGIGGYKWEGAGTIRIKGGNLNVSGVQGAAIGSGYYYKENDFGSIYIAGGTVNASSNRQGAAIGGSAQGRPANVYITGGKVTAKTKDNNAGACIGSGRDGMFGGEISISGGYIEATATSKYTTAIGGGYSGVCPNITISGGTIKATGGVASIGTAGVQSSGGSLKITGGSISTNNNEKPTINLTPTNDGTTPVYYTTINVDEIYGKDASVNNASITGYDYGFTDVKTDANGVLHLYLPESAVDTKTEASFSNVNYNGKITSGDSNVLKIPAVFTAEADTITGTGASLHAAYEGSASVYYVASSTELNTGSEVENASGVQSMTMSDGIASTILSGLKENTEYTYYLVVKTGDVYSNVIPVTFTTKKSSNLYTINTQTKNTNLGTVGEGGTYVAGAEITLTAKPRMGCKFVKWSSDADGNTEVSTERNLTVTVNSSSTYYAWFAKDKYMLTVGDFNCDAGTVSGVKEEGYSYNEEATLIAEAKTAYAFEGWKNEYCVTVTTSSAISFQVSDNMTITPIFRQINESTTYCAISFYHQSGNLLKSEMVEANSTITFTPPITPSKIGYDFLGWSTDGKNPIELNQDGSITITSDMFFKPLFKAKEETFSLTVNGAETAYKPLSSVTSQVAAEDIPEGKQFAYWKDVDGKIVSYSNPYKFSITGNLELTAEYEDSTKDVIKEPTLTLSAPTYELVSTGKHKMIWYAAMYLPEGYTLVESGILRVVSTTPQTAEQMIFDSEGIYRRIIQVSSSIANQYYYSVSASDGKGVSVRAYVVVRNKDGNLETIFSDVQYGYYSGN